MHVLLKIQLTKERRWKSLSLLYIHIAVYWVNINKDKLNFTVPDEPTKVTAEAINSTAMFVEWRPPEGRGSNGIIRGYYVYYYETNMNDEMVGQELVHDTHDGNRNEAVITNLKADTVYSVQVAGYTRRGDGKRSKKRTINTKGAGTHRRNC